MKFIDKCSEPKEFAAWKALENQDWQPTYKYLRGAPKRAVDESLRKEQGNLCCYCERPLRDGDYLKRDDTGRYQEFWTTIHYLFGERALGGR